MNRPNFISQADAYTRINWNNLTEKYYFNLKDIYFPPGIVFRSDEWKENFAHALTSTTSTDSLYKYLNINVL